MAFVAAVHLKSHGTRLVGRTVAIALGLAMAVSGTSLPASASPMPPASRQEHTGFNKAITSQTGQARYVPVTPARICDTRPGNPSALSGAAAQCNGALEKGSTLSPGAVLNIDVAGIAGISTRASAVTATLTAVNPSTSGYLIVYPQGSPVPHASSLNFQTGHTVANLVSVALSPTGEISVYNSSGYTNVLVDVMGYYLVEGANTAGGLYEALYPQRICDTRPGNPSALSGAAAQCNGHLGVKSSAPLTVQVSGVAGVPSSGVEAVALQVAATDASEPGYLSAYPTGVSRPTVSVLNYAKASTVAARVILEVPADGSISIFASAGDPQVLVGIQGWFTSAAGSNPTTTGAAFEVLRSPTRICDTRPGNPSALSGAAAQCNGALEKGSTLSPGATFTITVAGIAGVPLGATEVELNLTATNETSSGYLSVYPAGESPRPASADLSFDTGRPVAELDITTPSQSGQVSIYNSAGTTNVIVDLLGWAAPAPQQLLFGVAAAAAPTAPSPGYQETGAWLHKLADGRPFLVHIYTNWDQYPSDLPALADTIQALSADRLKVELVLRYVPPAGANGDVTGFAGYVAAMVRYFAHQAAVTRIQVTNEANSPINPAASDGYYNDAQGALVDGIEAAAAARESSGSMVRLGFNWFYSFGPVEDRAWWAKLGEMGGPSFADDVSWVGVDAYPGTYYPPGSPEADPTDPGATPSEEIEHILSYVRSDMLLAGLDQQVSLGFSEIGWPTGLQSSQAEQASMLDQFVIGACAAGVQDHATVFQWFDLMDGAFNFSSLGLSFGLMGADFAPKAAFWSYQSMIGKGCTV